MPSWYLPDGQCSQLFCFRFGANLPFLHDLHANPDLEWNLPIGQSVHSVDGATANWPESHGKQFTALYVVLMRPLGHCWQIP